MKIFKKVSAIVASALMVGMSMGVAAAVNYPVPFVQGGASDVGIVVGSGAAPSDGIEAGAINLNLNSYATGTSGGSTTVSGSGGDFKVLSNSARTLYYGDALNAAITGGLTNTDLPTLLAQGTFSDLAGVQYPYTQTIKLGSANTTFSTSAGDFPDPKLLLDVGTVVNSNNFVYNYTLTLSKNINVTDTTNVVGQPITILGQSYVIGAGSNYNVLYLNGAGTDTILSTVGTPTTVTIGGTAHTVALTAVTATNQATIVVDGQSKTVTQASTYSYAGGLNVYVKQITYQAYAGGVQSVELLIGSSSLKIVDGQNVKTGNSYNSIQGTSATVTGTSGAGTVSGFTIQFASNSSTGDFILPGGSWIDPVFGAIKLNFVDAVPDVASPARASVEFSSDGGTNPQFEYVTFTSARAGTAGQKKLTVVYDNNTASTGILPVLAHTTVVSGVTTNGIIHVLENESGTRNDWYVVNAQDLGTIVSYDSFDPGNGQTGTLGITDVITGQSQSITLTNTTGNYINTAAAISGGTGYRVIVQGNGTVANATLQISWNSGTTALFPRIKLASGGWIALAQETNTANATSNLLLPNGKTALDTTGTNFVAGNNNETIVNGVDWLDTNNTAGNKIWGINTSSGTVCNFNVTRGPALLIFEPKKYNDASQGDFICIPQSTTASTALSIADAQFNGTKANFITLTSDSTQKQTLDNYGTFVVEKTPTNTNGDVIANIPASQMYVDMAISAVATSVTPNSGGGAAGATIGNVVVLDSQVGSMQSHNLIVVGGSCINSVAAGLVGGAKCSADWTTATGVGSGQFLIQSFANPNTAGKVALLVAGYEAQDTINAANFLMNRGVDTTVGKKYVGTDANTASLVVASS